jgi:hypothetical protein
VSAVREHAVIGNLCKSGPEKRRTAQLYCLYSIYNRGISKDK